MLEVGVLGDEVSRLDASLDAHLQAVASRMGFVPHIVPRNGFYCEESWSEWQDLNLRPFSSRTREFGFHPLKYQRFSIASVPIRSRSIHAKLWPTCGRLAGQAKQ